MVTSDHLAQSITAQDSASCGCFCCHCCCCVVVIVSAADAVAVAAVPSVASFDALLQTFAVVTDAVDVISVFAHFCCSSFSSCFFGHCHGCLYLGGTNGNTDSNSTSNRNNSV